MVGEVLFSDKISIERLLSLVTFIILLLAIFRIDLYEDHNYHRANESSFLKGLNPIQSQTLFVVLLWEGGWGVRIEFFVKKRYGKTRVGGFLFSTRVELLFFIPCAFWWNMNFSTLSLSTCLLFETFVMASQSVVL